MLYLVSTALKAAHCQVGVCSLLFPCIGAYSPDGVILLVVGPTAVARQPSQSDCELRCVARQVVWCVGLSALHHQLGGRHNGGHLVARHTLVVAEVCPPQVLDGDVPTHDAYPALRQRATVPLRQEHNRQSIKPQSGRRGREPISNRF